MLISTRQEPREALGPVLLPSLVRDQILTDFDQGMRQAMALAVHRYGIVGAIADKIRLVIADQETALLAQQSEQAVGQAAVAIVEKRRMPGPRLPFEHRREAVQRDQRCGPAGLPPARELGLDALVIGLEDRLGARFFLRVAQADIAGNDGILADFGNGACRVERPVAVDHQSRIVLPDQRRAECIGEMACEPGNADIAADMALPFGRGNAEPAERARAYNAGMISNQEKRRSAVCILHRDGRRLVRRQKRLRRLIRRDGVRRFCGSHVHTNVCNILAGTASKKMYGDEAPRGARGVVQNKPPVLPHRRGALRRYTCRRFLICAC